MLVDFLTYCIRAKDKIMQLSDGELCDMSYLFRTYNRGAAIASISILERKGG